MLAAANGSNNGAGEAADENVARADVAAVINQVAQVPQNVEIEAPTEG